METVKLSDKDTIEVQFKEDDISISIKYNKHSHLKTRYEMIDKFKGILRTI